MTRSERLRALADALHAARHDLGVKWATDARTGARVVWFTVGDNLLAEDYEAQRMFDILPAAPTDAATCEAVAMATVGARREAGCPSPLFADDVAPTSGRARVRRLRL